MNNLSIAVAALLIDIEKELREMRLWEFERPSEESLSSLQPFAVDTLAFPQWLQFIFLPRMYYLLEQGQPFPRNCSIAPMAEQYFSSQDLRSSVLIAHLQKIDELLTRAG